MKKSLRTILLIIAILIVLALIIAIRVSKANKENGQVQAGDSEEVIAQKNANGVKEKISNMSESDRVKSYVGEFLTDLQTQKYDEAYNDLNDDFKQNYFADITKFEEYVKGKYPSNPKVSYTNVRRQGEIYIVTVSISDIFNKDFATFEQRFIVRENAANEYKISFNVD